MDVPSGGAVACVTAGRLAAADPSLKILVRICSSATCGHSNCAASRYWKLVHIRRTFQPIYSLLEPTEMWYYPHQHSVLMSPSPVRQWLIALLFVRVEDASVADRASTVRISFHYLIYRSRINFTVMLYTRANRSDYDDWENRFHNPGWGSKYLIPLLMKVVLDTHPPACVNSDSI
jgi:GMC oxidoreductase